MHEDEKLQVVLVAWIAAAIVQAMLSMNPTPI